MTKLQNIPAPNSGDEPTAAIPIIVKIPVPTTAPMPSIIKSKAFKFFFNFELFDSFINSSAVFLKVNYL
ncbi:MAG: hypothetical protein L6V95_13290 [Candidatus Melainabacteria bacterium]|nr:MAG: hypothetical protein L6V95_13290 [Candidatus Melainabacteria bacterium]